MNIVRYEVKTVDRVGMVLDVLRIVYLKKINIILMEVAPQLINLKMELDPSQEDSLIKALQMIPGVQGVTEINLLHQEEREQKLRGILDTVGEGIIAVDKNGEITMINSTAQSILRLDNKVEGKNVQEVFSAELPILDTLRTGDNYDNNEIFISLNEGDLAAAKNSAQKRSHYLSSGRPIIDDSGDTVGAVAAIKDINEVRKLVHSISHPAMVCFNDMIVESEQMRTAVTFAQKVAKGDSTVLLTGESGTGKELFARAIHMESFRRECPFVPINCSAIPDSLLESELFGYEEGAFTGAKKGGKHGLFELANHGTIFLDEVGDLNPQIQIKLLRVLQEKKVRRIGGKEEIPVDIRVISATNQDLEDLVQQGYFREDLYYRLNVIPIKLPPLRERETDIIPLFSHILAQILSTSEASKYYLPHESKIKLQEYQWPGNVRELENVIERAVNLVSDYQIKPEHLYLGDYKKISQLLDGNSKEFQQKYQISSNELQIDCQDKLLPEVMAEVEREILIKTLNKTDSARKAAEKLGVSHTTILNKIKKYDLLDYS